MAVAAAVNTHWAAAAVAVAKGDGWLEDVALVGCGVRRGHAEQLAQLTYKALCGRQLAGR